MILNVDEVYKTLNVLDLIVNSIAIYNKGSI